MKAFALFLLASYVVAEKAPGTTICRKKFEENLRFEYLNTLRLGYRINKAQTMSECLSIVKNTCDF